VLIARRLWFDGQLDLDSDRLVFIDETGASTKMARLRGRALRGERCRAPVPHGHVWTPPLMQEETFRTRTEHGRVLPCVRPLMRRFTCRGPVWDPGARSTSLERALIALPVRLVLLTPSHRRCAIPVL
jgi:hypothetical protein